MKYYVYALTNPITNVVFYIGKGSGKRYAVHLNEKKSNTENKKKYAVIKHLKNKGLTPDIKIISYFENESEAYDLEKRLIQFFGRQGLDTNGCLTNICLDNRPPDSKGRRHSDEFKSNLSEARKGEKNPMFGKTKELHHNYGKPGLSGEDNPFYGKTHTDELKLRWKGWDRLNAKGKDDIEIYGYEVAMLRRKRISEGLQNGAVHNAKCWRIITPDNKIIYKKGLTTFAAQNNIPISLLHRINKKRKLDPNYSEKNWVCEEITEEEFKNG
jgi:hypothetical protein